MIVFKLLFQIIIPDSSRNPFQLIQRNFSETNLNKSIRLNPSPPKNKKMFGKYLLKNSTPILLKTPVASPVDYPLLLFCVFLSKFP